MMIQELTDIFQTSITFGDIAKNLGVAFLCGLIIAFFYKKSFRGPSYMFSFVNALVLLAMITAMVIMVIGNNLARAFGLVGAMSIIRFRTAVKDTQDIVFIFFSLTIGMAAGVGLHVLAITSSILIGSITILLSKSNLLTAIQKNFLLQFTYARGAASEEAEFNSVMDKYCRSIKLINIKSLNGSDMVEYSYYISFKKNMSSADFVRDLQRSKNMKQVNVFFDEENF
ncbi:MAG: DUF4956 domain-containing protein [bacterium]